jgi:FkbM family methyltransferase
MPSIFQDLKQLLPKSIKTILRRVYQRGRHTQGNFRPYLKKKNVEGEVFDFWIGDSTGRDWYDLSCTDPVWIELRFIKHHLIREGDIVLECGGHHGCTTILLSKWVGGTGRVIAFEPSPTNCEILAKNIKQNALSNVMLERKAVGAAMGSITIGDTSNASVSSSGVGVRVEMTCLDQYEHLHPTCLKIDVEGFEVDVVKGAKKILSSHPKMAIEIHPDQLSCYGTSVDDLFRAMDLEYYTVWIQWEDELEPERYDMATPITKRVQLFFIPSGKLSTEALLGLERKGWQL